MDRIHIVSFNNPFPPDYGGVIDVYYKIKALHEAGIAVILHVFEYNRPQSPELLKICEDIFYYPRKTGWLAQLSLIPYIVRSRNSQELLINLQKDQYPILFEGLHSCQFLNHPSLQKRIKLVRMHNIEHEYYVGLAKASRDIKSRLFYYIESEKLKHFETILRNATHILAISVKDAEYFSGRFGKTCYIPAFHSNTSISCKNGTGKFILMHGNLEVEENEKSVLHCVRNILSYIDFPVVIAGKNPSFAMKAELVQNKNIVLVDNPGEEEMERLQHDAHIHLCYTLQQSGLKLKLLNALFKGRFVVANTLMTEGSGLTGLTLNGKNDKELIEIIRQTIPLTFTDKEIADREIRLSNFSNKLNAAKITDLI